MPRTKNLPERKKKVVIMPTQVEEDVENNSNKQVAIVYEPLMLCVYRIKSIPVVISILDVVSSMYDKIRSCSCITKCLCKNAEKTAKSALQVVESLNSCSLLQCPIRTFDTAVCLSLDYVECNFPGIKLPPEEIYSNTKSYVLDVSKRFGEYPLKFIQNIKQYGVNTIADIHMVSSCAKDTVSDVISVLSTPVKDRKHQLTHEDTRNWKFDWTLIETVPLLNRMSMFLSVTYHYFPSQLHKDTNEGELNGEVEDCAIVKFEYEMIFEAIRCCPDYRKRKHRPTPSDNSLSMSSSSTSLSGMSSEF